MKNYQLVFKCLFLCGVLLGTLFYTFETEIHDLHDSAISTSFDGSSALSSVSLTQAEGAHHCHCTLACFNLTMNFFSFQALKGAWLVSHSSAYFPTVKNYQEIHLSIEKPPLV